MHKRLNEYSQGSEGAERKHIGRTGQVVSALIHKRTETWLANWE
jgi:hypothetical protein